MRIIHKYVFLANLFFLGGCDEERDLDKVYTDFELVDSNTLPNESLPTIVTPDDFTNPWVVSSDSDYLSENSVSFSATDSITVVDASATNTESFERLNDNGERVYGFDDVTFEAVTLGEYVVVNNTPDRISTLLITSTSFSEPVALKMDSALPPFSRSTVVFQQNITDIELFNTTNMYLPNITLTGDVSAQDGLLCTSFCYSVPNAQQAEVYGILSSNLHKALNHKEFLPEITRFYNENWCSDSNNSCAPNIANVYYMQIGSKGHQLGLKVLSGPYVNEGVGGGLTPSLSRMTASTGGWASIWSEYISEGSSSSRPYEERTQKTYFHEGAHGHGYGHDSGMTYGFADYYGLEFLEKYFPDEDISGVSELKPAAIVPILIEAKNKYLKFKLLTLDNGNSLSRVFSRVITAEGIAKKDRFVVENNVLFYELELEQFPTKVIVIQFYDDVNDMVYTTREVANFYQPEVISLSGSQSTFMELPQVVLEGKTYYNVNSTCTKYLPGSRGATKADYQLLWSAGDFNPSQLRGRYFISSNMSQSYHRWRVDMKDADSFSVSSEASGTQFGDEDSLLCVDKLDVK